MSEIKYRIPFGNCENDLNTDILDQTVSTGQITWDRTDITWDSTIITFDKQ
jgi:hypothetical protein